LITTSEAQLHEGWQALLSQIRTLVGMLEAFAIYTVGFIARPIGAAIFG
jgi:hypothetical protein